MIDAPRDERMLPDPSTGGGRSVGARDRDRILHTYALRRLADVTQVVGPHEGMHFHNRLTHSLEVAQIARRLAERFVREAPGLVNRLGGIEPEVCEAAGLAHDLGHPPFGHIAEKVLDGLGQKHGLNDGFEGNAQSFRILTRLAAHRIDYHGLNLSRATLNAVLKYPWPRAADVSEPRHHKFGVYEDDLEAFKFARRSITTDHRTAEAEIMNLADDIAYCVHDFDDFHRAGLLPLHTLKGGLLEQFIGRWVSAKPRLKGRIEQQRERLTQFLELLIDETTYRGTFSDRAHFRARSSQLIDRYVSAAMLQEPDSDGATVVVSPEIEAEIEFLKRLVFEFVIERPGLGAQQEGQRRVIRELFDTYVEACRRIDESIVPGLYLEELREIAARNDSMRGPAFARLSLDIVSGLTERQAVVMYGRFTGHAPGSVVDFTTQR